MAAYAASKCAVEGCTESMGHEICDHGVRSLLVEPACTRTGFEANSAKPDTPLHAHAKLRQTVDRVMAEAISGLI
ncbi:SDR family NAD(P)-dependent oxidoreductase [Streptomyces sp. NBC_01537]|uniref:SDR family NAD(P)-dependent oxidoreductase n=1 Tax=Streptomyces sp. NBC_01537 TaxID=2903896 RepID=UPI00386CA148